ncbi:hypothetical protein JTE90_021405 [Oedothorax gibbosus]|uniref:Uncharacterized protein n=1 Tax=Oedothorax gibbosus TaxID=931172 RepID=A0AAV6VE40_9ARAC|nr:hypothetical protein JTE90_021405 [Oedothorax gibbosus]
MQGNGKKVSFERVIGTGVHGSRPTHANTYVLPDMFLGESSNGVPSDVPNPVVASDCETIFVAPLTTAVVEGATKGLPFPEGQKVRGTRRTLAQAHAMVITAIVEGATKGLPFPEGQKIRGTRRTLEQAHAMVWIHRERLWEEDRLQFEEALNDALANQLSKSPLEVGPEESPMDLSVESRRPACVDVEPEESAMDLSVKRG